MKFNTGISGKYYTATDNSAITYVLRDDGRFAGTGGSTDLGENRVTVMLSGWQMNSKSGTTMSETISGEWIDIADGWTPTGNKITYSKRQAQALVDGIINNNEKVLCNNIICARFRNKLTAEQKTQLYNLQTRLVARNDALQNDNLVKVSTIGTPKGYSELEDYLTSFMESGGVGSVSLVTIVIVAAVLTGAATAAYFCYKKYYDESEQDVKYSNELTKILTSKLTDEEYEMLKEETRGIVTRASIRSRLGAAGKYFIYGGIALLVGFSLLRYFNKNK